MINRTDVMLELLRRQKMENKEIAQKYSNLCAKIGHSRIQLLHIRTKMAELEKRSEEMEKQRRAWVREASELLRVLDAATSKESL